MQFLLCVYSQELMGDLHMQVFLLSAGEQAAAAVNMCTQIPSLAADSSAVPHPSNHKVVDGTMVTTLSP